jgi:hypothetical protein
LEFKALNQISKKKYVSPEINKLQLDNSISLIMMSGPGDPPPPPIGTGKKGTNEPFKSPFGDKPFG